MSYEGNDPLIGAYILMDVLFVIDLDVWYLQIHLNGFGQHLEEFKLGVVG